VKTKGGEHYHYTTQDLTTWASLLVREVCISEYCSYCILDRRSAKPSLIHHLLLFSKILRRVSLLRLQFEQGAEGMLGVAQVVIRLLTIHGILPRHLDGLHTEDFRTKILMHHLPMPRLLLQHHLLPVHQQSDLSVP